MRGFTLIELMMVVVIVAILAAIAIPGYTYFMKKSRRGDAESILMDIAQREQQYLNDSRSYAATPAALYGVATNNAALPADVSSYYTIYICQTAVTSPCAVPGGTPPAFVASAVPIAGSAQAGDYTLTLDNTGARGPTSAW